MAIACSKFSAFSSAADYTDIIPSLVSFAFPTVIAFVNGSSWVCFFAVSSDSNFLVEPHAHSTSFPSLGGEVIKRAVARCYSTDSPSGFTLALAAFGQSSWSSSVSPEVNSVYLRKVRRSRWGSADANVRTYGASTSGLSLLALTTVHLASLICSSDFFAVESWIPSSLSVDFGAYYPSSLGLLNAFYANSPSFVYARDAYPVSGSSVTAFTLAGIVKRAASMVSAISSVMGSTVMYLLCLLFGFVGSRSLRYRTRALS